MSWCPKCNEIRKTDENFCAKCGNELIVDPTCPDYKQRYEDGTIQCPKDGAYLVSAGIYYLFVSNAENHLTMERILVPMMVDKLFRNYYIQRLRLQQIPKQGT